MMGEKKRSGGDKSSVHKSKKIKVKTSSDEKSSSKSTTASSEDPKNPSSPTKKAQKAYIPPIDEKLIEEKWALISKDLQKKEVDPCGPNLPKWASDSLLTLPHPHAHAQSTLNINHHKKLVRSKSMDDYIYSAPTYPSLFSSVEEHESGDKYRSYEISKSCLEVWSSVSELEKGRFSFYDQLFSIGAVVDSMEVPGRLDDISYFVEADQEAYSSQIDYARLVFKTKHVFIGNLSNWHFKGPGRYIWQEGTIYQGDFCDGVMHGEGVILWPDGSVFQGEFQNGHRNGWGVYTTGTGVMYAGEWKDGVPEGVGKAWYDPQVDDCDYYDGEWVNGSPHGVGVRQFCSGDRYIGHFENGTRKGKGTMIWLQERQVYNGEWLNGLPNGPGQHTWYLPRTRASPYPERNTYKGEFRDGERHGVGRMVYACGSIYDGHWSKGLKHGKGAYVNPAGELLFAIFRHGAIAGGAEVPLHKPTYSSKFQPLLSVLHKRYNNIDTSLSSVDEEHISSTVLRFLPQIKSLYKRAGYLGNCWGNQSAYPEWLKKDIIHRHHEHKRHMKEYKNQKMPNMERIGQEFDDEKYLHGHVPHFGSPDSVNPVTRYGVWLLLKDSPLVLDELTLAELDNFWLSVSSISFQTRHNPFEPVQLWQFIQCLIIVGVMLYVDIPRRTFHLEGNVDNDEEIFEEFPKPPISPPDDSISNLDVEKNLPDLELPKLPIDDRKKSDSSSKSKSSKNSKNSQSSKKSKDSTSGQKPLDPTNPPEEDVEKSKNRKKGSESSSKSNKSTKSDKNDKNDDDENRRKSSKKRTSSSGSKKRSSTKSEEMIQVVRKENEAQTVFDLLKKEERGAQTVAEDESTTDEENEKNKDNYLHGLEFSEAFDLLLNDILIPTLSRKPGQFLPTTPTPLPSLPDLHSCFKSTFSDKELISAREFIQSVLPPSSSTVGPIFWTRSADINPPEVDLDKLFNLNSSSSEIITHFSSFLSQDYLSDKLSGNLSNLSEELKSELNVFEETRSRAASIFSQQQQGAQRGRGLSIFILKPGNTVFGDEGEAQWSATNFREKFSLIDSNLGLDVLKSQMDSHVTIESDIDTENVPVAENDLTPDVFLWSSEPICAQTHKNMEIFKNLGLSDILKVLRQYYPRTCSSKNVIDLEFDLTFGDWVWLLCMVTKLSAERAFSTWMAKADAKNLKCSKT